MSQIKIFNSMKREPFEATYPPKHFDQHMKNPLYANVRMTDFKIEENGVEVKCFAQLREEWAWKRYQNGSIFSIQDFKVFIMINMQRILFSQNIILTGK